MHRLVSLMAAVGSAMMILLALPAQAQDVIKIAAGAPLTGPLAKQGQEVANAVKLAVDEWNAKGGVLGKKIEVVEADDQGNPQVGVAAAEKVAADPAVMGSVWGITIGHLHSGLRGARPLQHRADHARLHQSEGDRSRPEDRSIGSAPATTSRRRPAQCG